METSDYDDSWDDIESHLGHIAEIEAENAKLQAEVRRLKSIMAKTLYALLRKNTNQDGNWGHPYFKDEIADLIIMLEKTK
jgi:hypothetical protein